MLEPDYLKKHFLIASICMITNQFFPIPPLFKYKMQQNKTSSWFFVESKPTHPFKTLYVPQHFKCLQRKDLNKHRTQIQALSFLYPFSASQNYAASCISIHCPSCIEQVLHICSSLINKHTSALEKIPMNTNVTKIMTFFPSIFVKSWLWKPAFKLLTAAAPQFWEMLSSCCRLVAQLATRPRKWPCRCSTLRHASFL